jgi:serine/threonine protein kinase
LSITIGTQLGSHEIIALLGKGGMGEVYRARDTRLKREVAIKILPEEFSRDPDRVARFQREAEVLASLNHPNVAAIHNLEVSNGFRYLVLELVEGETLADRIARGPIPVEEALTIAKGICEALAAAHEKGIIHRDLKPANVKITPGAQVKVLDFGLAKALESSPVQTTLSNSPTLLSGTMGGIILGTAAYMSPEQARGRAADERTDVFAFGCVLYEMLTGRPAFEGEDLTEILGRVVTTEPDWQRLPATTPPSIRRLLRALKKDPRHRLSDIRDARIEIDDADAHEVGPSVPSVQRRPVAWISALAIALALIVALAIPTWRYFRETSPPEVRLEIHTPSSNSAAFALSPDSRYIVYAASGDGTQRLWLRALNNTEARPIAGTDGAEGPFWSPDSRSIGFFAGNKLYRVEISGGPPQMVANSLRGRGVQGSWNAAGTILFDTAVAGPLWRVSASGGQPSVLQLGLGGSNQDKSPQFLPDGQHFLFYLGRFSPQERGVSGIYLGSLGGEQPKRLVLAEETNLAGAAFLPPNRLLYIKQGSLVARQFDLARGELSGDAIRVAAATSADYVVLGFSVSSNGDIAYRVGRTARSELAWLDRTGMTLEVITKDAGTPDLSRDGQRVAFQRIDENNSDVYVMDLLRGTSKRFTFDGAADEDPVWSPDGTQIAFRSTRKGSSDLYIKPSDGSGEEQLLLENPNLKLPQDWSKDGKFLLYAENDPKTGYDLWTLEMTGKDGKKQPVVTDPADQRNGQFSPDGRWIAYESSRSGKFDIFVQAFPKPGSQWQVSMAGGITPRWSANGKELYFIAPDGNFMAASVSISGATFEAGVPKVLFPFGRATNAMFKHQYAVSPDGRFLVVRGARESPLEPITLILNWHPEQKK